MIGVVAQAYPKQKQQRKEYELRTNSTMLEYNADVDKSTHIPTHLSWDDGQQLPELFRDVNAGLLVQDGWRRRTLRVVSLQRHNHASAEKQCSPTAKASGILTTSCVCVPVCERCTDIPAPCPASIAVAAKRISCNNNQTLVTSKHNAQWKTCAGSVSKSQ